MTDALQVAISQDFFVAFAAIPRAQQKKVNHFVSKFRNNPRANGINYEKINDAASSNYRSVRIDQDYRGIVLKPDLGSTYLLLWVDKHDAAYDWARRHCCVVNEETGSLQLYETLHPDEVSPTEHAKAVDASPLLDCRERELLRLGVPRERLEQVKALTSQAELDVIKPQLPVEVFEALCFLADGIPLDEVMEEYALAVGGEVNPADLEAALSRPQSQRRFRVVKGELELQQMLEAPLEQWRVFLHPTQRRLVERHWNGPVRVLGGAGTGKTVVAMHRAKWLVENVLGSDERLLFTTFTHNLAVDIEANLRSICSPQQMKQIEVIHIDAWVKRFLQREGQAYQIRYPSNNDYKQCWDLAYALNNAAVDLPEAFYQEEWEQVVLPQRVTSKRDYFAASRVGRGVPLNRRMRAEIWTVFEEMRFQLHQKGLLTAPDAVFSVIDLLANGAVQRPYRAAIVDEVQDMGTEVLQLIRHLVAKAADDLLLAGDGHQRIYGRKAAMSHCDINIRGRGKRLRINYRTTESIRRWAVGVLEGADYDDLDDGIDEIYGYRSLVDGAAPFTQGLADAEAEAGWVATSIEDLLKEGYLSQDICLVARTITDLKKVQRHLDEKGIAHRELSRDQADDHQLAGVRLANMHRVKGLEFKVVFLVGIREGRVPLSWALDRIHDPVERRAREAGERSLLHVAATRAAKLLFVSWYGEASCFISQS